MKNKTRTINVSPRLPLRVAPALAVAVLIAFCPLPTRANLIVNPGFETGDFTGWTTQAASSGSNFGVNNANPHSGNFAAFFAADGSGSPDPSDHISQTLTTTPGAFYDLSFWVASNGVGILAVFWGGSQVDGIGFFGTTPYSTLGMDSHLVQASSSSTVLEFEGDGFNNGGGGTVFLDDVSVTLHQSVPELFSTLWLTLPALLMLGVARFHHTSEPETAATPRKP